MSRLVNTVALWCLTTVAAYEHGTSTGQFGWLEDHNYYRCLHGADAVTWDAALEGKAQTLANKQTMSHSDSYNEFPSSGENIAMGMGSFTCGDYSGPYNQNCATYNWYHEYTDCWAVKSLSSGWQAPACTIGHFTAMVWKGVTKIGCAESCSGSTCYYVCEYGSDRCDGGTSDTACWNPSPPGLPNFNSGSCGTECVEAASSGAGCELGTSVLGTSYVVSGLASTLGGGNAGVDSGVLWKGLLAWAIISVICFAIFGADAAGKCNLCDKAAVPGGAPPAGEDGETAEEQPAP